MATTQVKNGVVWQDNTGSYHQEQKEKNASDKFLVTFSDGKTKETDRFTLAVTFKTGLLENEDGSISYTGKKYNFIARRVQ